MRISTILYRLILIISLCLPSLINIGRDNVSANDVVIPFEGGNGYFQSEPKSTTNYTVIGDTVKTEVANGDIKVTPHTLTSSGWVTVEYYSKSLTGDVDVSFGFDGKYNIKPMRVESWESYSHPMVRLVDATIDDVFTPSKLISKKDLVKKDVEAAGTIIDIGDLKLNDNVATIEYELDIPSVGITSFKSTIAYGSFSLLNGSFNYKHYGKAIENYTETYEDWKQSNNDVSKSSDVLEGSSDWNTIKLPQTVSLNTWNKVRFWIDIPFNGKDAIEGKYNVVIKPNGVSLTTAKAQGSLIVLDPWYSATWLYRKSIVIAHTDDGAQTDYQVKFLIGESSGASGEQFDLGGKCATDFDDLRFTTDTGNTLINYWIESVSGATPNQLATVWVKVPSIAAHATDTTIYVYYGNSGATAASDGVLTFPTFDHFTGASINATTWTTIGTPSLSFGSSIMTMVADSNAVYEGIASNTDLSTSAMRAYVKFGTKNATPIYVGFVHNDWNTPFSEWLSYTTVEKFNSYVTSSENTLFDLDEANYHIYDVRYVNNVGQYGYYDDVLKGSHTTQKMAISDVRLLIYNYRIGIDKTSYTDWALTRKFTANEPAYSSVGSEEATPSVTTNAASSVGATTATLNGTITAVYPDASHRGFAWGTTSNATTPNSAQAPPAGYTSSNITAGTYGAGTFTDARTGLSSGTSYYFRAAANNTVGWGWGSEQTFLTLPAAPTNVAASDSDSTKVTITWTKSTGATNYAVFRDATEISGWLGDVATYDDSGANAPVITPGSAVASDGTSTSNVSLSITGSSIADGTTHTYKVRAKNATGNSSDSSTDEGYRPKGTLTYQWRVSASTTDDTFSNITGGTTASYIYTSAPAPTITGGTASATDGTSTTQTTLSIAGESANVGATRYYYCILSATGSNPQDTTHNAGYIGVGSLVYQWYRSASTGDADYSSLAGATTDPYNDTSAPEPTITAGTASASDGSSASFVTLSNTGEVGVNGAVRYYKANLTATGAATANTTANDGYRGTTTLTYVWQRSAADSDASYSNITGGTTDPYNDTGAPADGSGRYFKVIVSMTGASSNTTLADRGYRLYTYDITNAPASKAFGAVTENTVYYAKGTAPNDPVVDGDCTFTLTNTGSVPIDISTHSHDFTGGAGWTLVSDYPSTMGDPFTDNSLDTDKFIESTNAGSLVVEQNNRLELTSAASVSGFVRSTNSYQLTETQTIIKVSQHSTDGGFKFCPTVVTDHMWDVFSEADWYNFQLVAGSAVSAVRKKSGSASTLATSGALTTPYWLRMRVTGGEIFFEYANNKATKPNEYGWTELTHEAWNLGVPITTAEYVYLTAYNTPTTGIAYVTDFEHGTITSLGDMKARMTGYYSGQSLADAVVLTTSNQPFINNLLATNTTKWDFKLQTGGFTDGVQKATIITFTSTVH